ncbi:MAG: hypothetical protein ACLSHC_15235 [Bilophila wadsworthia]
MLHDLRGAQRSICHQPPSADMIPEDRRWIPYDDAAAAPPRAARSASDPVEQT